MTTSNPSNVTAAPAAAKEKANANVDSIDIDSLLEKLHQSEALLRERDAVIAEKDQQLSAALANNNTAPNHSLAHIPEDGSEAHASVLKAKVRTTEEVRLIRQMTQRGGAEWKSLSYGAPDPEAEDGTVSGEDDGHGSRTPWYNPPIQRQRWDEDQVLPHVNWGDIFFDLFYVGAAYNL